MKLKGDKVKELLPAPFDWCAIPAGKVTLEVGGYLKKKTTFDVPAFEMAKYPVTNAQFAKFMEADGYKTKDWWTDDGWAQCEKDKWTEPRYWQDTKWNGANQPILGVSWYESVAFCQWLSSVTGDKILLPTEQEWQRAAHAKPDGSNTGWNYVWGNVWDGKKCNNSVKPEFSNQTTVVTHYEKLGNVSPCGVVDLIGNVWEWCLTEYDTGKTDLEGINVRILHGNYWGSGNSKLLCVVYLNGVNPDARGEFGGFRLSRSI